MRKKEISIIKKIMKIISVVVLATILLLELYFVIMLLVVSPYEYWDAPTTIINDDALLALRVLGACILAVNVILVPMTIKKKKIFSLAYLTLAIISLIRLLHLFSIV